MTWQDCPSLKYGQIVLDGEVSQFCDSRAQLSPSSSEVSYHDGTFLRYPNANS